VVEWQAWKKAVDRHQPQWYQLTVVSPKIEG